MTDYINIKSILNLVPDYVKDDEAEINMLSWALQGYRENVRQSNVTDSYKVCIVPIVDNKATLPPNIKKVLETQWSYVPYTEINDSIYNMWIPMTINGYYVLVAEAILYTRIKHKGQSMRYVGQHPDLLDSNCVNIYCQSCAINFSLNKQLTQITTSETDGWVAIVYSTFAKDGDDFIIPNDNQLKQALAYFIEAMHWRERRGRKEEGANDMFLQNLSMSQRYFLQYIKSDMFSKFDADTYRKQVLGQFDTIQNQREFVNRKHI